MAPLPTAPNILPYMRVVTLTPRDRGTIRDVAAAGLRGSKIYDAVLVKCAGKQPIDRVYSFNVKDLRLLAPSELRDKVCAP